MCQSHTGRLTGLWFLPKPAFGLNTNDDDDICWVNIKTQCLEVSRAVRRIYTSLGAKGLRLVYWQVQQILIKKKSNRNTAHFSVGRDVVQFGGSLPTFMANMSPSSGSTFVWNIGTLLPNYTVSHIRGGSVLLRLLFVSLLCMKTTPHWHGNCNAHKYLYSKLSQLSFNRLHTNVYNTVTGDLFG